MMQSLEIKNYAIIEELHLDFSDRLTIITGETGAGKSILLGALGLVMGRRADNKSLFLKDKKCIIEATFQIKKYGLEDFFKEEDLDYEEQLIIRREIGTNGKSRAFVNDTPANLKTLQRLSGALLDLHQQFDTMDIHQVSFQLRMLDALANNAPLLAKYESEFFQYQKLTHSLKELQERQATSAREVEFLQFQLNEFSEVEPQPEEIEGLESEQKRLNGSEDVKRALGEVYENLVESENALLGQLSTLSQQVNQVKDLHADLPQLNERLSSIKMELEELAADFEKILDKTEHDPERLSVIADRLDALFRLQHKHKVTSTAGLIEIRERMEKELLGYEDLDADILQIQKEIVKFESSLAKQAQELSKRRKKVRAPFEKKIGKMLGQLGMEYAQIKIEISETSELNRSGNDHVNFLFAPNKGSDFQPIKDVASGGELSRLTLAIKSLVADAIPLPTLIFDEIDTGISGDVALKMGHILHELSDRHQVVSITHTPQIAVQADRHYFVYKQPEKNRTLTRVKLLDETSRIQEIATMLSGSPPTAGAIENAKELLAVD